MLGSGHESLENQANTCVEYRLDAFFARCGLSVKLKIEIVYKQMDYLGTD